MYILTFVQSGLNPRLVTLGLNFKFKTNRDIEAAVIAVLQERCLR